ncbi:FAD synthetase family protein [Bacillus alveayuensis]|uniref:FAD synthetase family protein n=1 Tax=Aeribacillus alveayuensis TaxID=279215 RepID=UPI000698D790|nr:FAD synthetase family protein [Bacillus alveayuensis]
MEVIHIDRKMSFHDHQFEPCVMALGFFDGIHLGHRKIIETAKQIAIEKNLTLAVMTFFPHPSQIIQTDKKVCSYLSPLSVKKEIFAELGVEKLFIVNFDMDFAKITHEQFVHQFLKKLMCKHAVAGFDFTFGYKGKGNMQRLEEGGKGLFEVTAVSEMKYKNKKISSTMIRHLLISGMVHEIPYYLGDYYSILGTIHQLSEQTKGAKSFKILINEEYMLPKSGIYDARLVLEGSIYNCMIHISEKTLNILEGAVIGFDDMSSDEIAKIKFIKRLPIKDIKNFFENIQLAI